MTSKSSDGGRTYERSVLLPGTDAPGNRGWESLTSFDNGLVAATWLDHRQLATDESTGHQHHAAGSEADGVAMAARSQLYFAPLDGRTAPRPLTGGVCYCCKTALATGMFGSPETIAIAWRHVYPGNIRDIAFTVSRDAGQTFSAPVRASNDHWAIAGCPDDGPAMAVDRAGRVHLVWPTAVTENDEPVKALFHTMTSDGVTFTPRVRLPSEGQANHPQIAVASDGSLVVIWDESGSGRRQIAAARATLDSGTMVFQRTSRSGDQTGVYPIITAVGDQLLTAWTTGSPQASTIRLVRVALSEW
jgi:hypothetical protein